MKTDTQHIIIVGLIIISLAFILVGQYNVPEGLAFGLLGFLSQKTLSDKQSETIEEYTLNGEKQ